MRQPITITIGETSFEIRPLTIRQMEAIESAVTDKSVVGMAQALAVIKAALSRDHAGVAIEDLEGTARDITGAVAAILRHGGFVEDPTPGEAPAGRTTGATSAPA